MKKILLLILALGFFSALYAQSNDHPIALAIHGGAGTIQRESMSAEQEAEYRAKLKEALQAGYQVLEQGGTSLDAVEAAIQLMEESPLFNAGKGAVFTNDGKNELDAAIMDGQTHQAGAVAGISHIKSPIAAGAGSDGGFAARDDGGGRSRAVCPRTGAGNGGSLLISSPTSVINSLSRSKLRKNKSLTIREVTKPTKNRAT